MKKLIYLLAVSSLVFTSSCGGGEEPKGDDKNEGTSENLNTGENDITGLREHSLSNLELNAVTYVPEAYYLDEEQTERLEQPDILHNDGEARWELKMKSDPHWHMVIEDWGDEERTVALEKKDHADHGKIFDFDYVAEGENYLLYSKILKSENTTIDSTQTSQGANYHFFCVQKIAGATVIFRSFEMGDFRRISAERMLNAARATREEQPA